MTNNKIDMLYRVHNLNKISCKKKTIESQSLLLFASKGKETKTQLANGPGEMLHS